MKFESKAHRPVIEMREDQVDVIVEGFATTFALRRAAGWAMVSPYHLKKWLEQGENDTEKGIESLYAQLFSKVGKALSDRAREFLEKLQGCPKNGTCLQWLLEKCFKNDYGSDTEEMKELIDLYSKLLESYKRLADNRQGALTHGREMDTESD
jgi:hypothetical protein